MFHDNFGDALAAQWRPGMRVSGTLVRGGKRVKITIHPDGTSDEVEDNLGSNNAAYSFVQSTGPGGGESLASASDRHPQPRPVLVPSPKSISSASPSSPRRHEHPDHRLARAGVRRRRAAAVDAARPARRPGTAQGARVGAMRCMRGVLLRVLLPRRRASTSRLQACVRRDQRGRASTKLIRRRSSTLSDLAIQRCTPSASGYWFQL